MHLFIVFITSIYRQSFVSSFYLVELLYKYKKFRRSLLFAAIGRKLRKRDTTPKRRLVLDEIADDPIEKPIIDIVGEPDRSVLRYRLPTVTVGTRRGTNGAARTRRLVDRDAINEINLPARWIDRL